MPALIHHLPEEIERARVLYEETEAPTPAIARLMGISVNSFHRRVNDWGWRRRRYRVAEVDRVAREGAASRDEAQDEALRALAEQAAEDRRSALDQAEDAVRGQLTALETMQRRVAAAALTAIDGERGARTIHTLARALREIEKIRAETGCEPAGEGGADERYKPENIDALRLDIARRLDILREQHEAGYL